MSDRPVRARRREVVADAKPPNAWVDSELAGCAFRDERLGKRIRSLLERLSASPGETIPLVCQDWANTEAAYRFLDNDRVSEAEILPGHFHATRDRSAATDGPILVPHDTTEFSFKREDIDAVGITRKAVAGVFRDGTPRHYTACGILMHSSLAVTTEGLPLGLAAVKFWTREKFKGTNALNKKINTTRIDRGKGKHSLAREPSAIDRAARGANAMCAHRRSGERHLRAVLRGPRRGNTFSAAHLR